MDCVTRKLHRLITAAVLGSFGFSSAATAGGQLTLLCWEGYADKSFVEPFEAETGCKVNAVYVGTNDEIVSKIMSGGGTADLISPSNDTTMRLVNADAVSPIDESKVPNMADFIPEFKRPAWDVKDGKLWGVPYGWGVIRIIADASVVDPNTDSLGFLWDSKYAGKLSMWDDIETVYTASRYLGFKNTYDLSDEQLEQVKAKLIAMKPNIRKYWFTTGEMGTLIASGEAIGGNSWESTIVQLRADGKKVADLKPKEGRGGWSDSWMIVKGSESNPCVYPWLNYVSSAKAQALAHKVTGFGYPNVKMADELDENTKAAYTELGMTDPATLTNVDWWQPVKRRAKYLEIWNQVKAASN
ncbi:ABC transporter substrate-binding protein [Hyphomicrobium facile]|uniref:Spermidine/putrescine transport system substrate-binding protein n=1 Tax=Hyphomicrobium facile TaxID=51670 RepID=A0A1I7MTT8_9HYPH|nr:ABC transporter substrate-binding protein [Hyphomicrobium facile]SFV25810.1 spermidine/putrescine transport system substrate-binding protein [Hyphomicrobium facile]